MWRPNTEERGPVGFNHSEPCEYPQQNMQQIFIFPSLISNKTAVLTSVLPYSDYVSPKNHSDGNQQQIEMIGMYIKGQVRRGNLPAAWRQYLAHNSTILGDILCSISFLNAKGYGHQESLVFDQGKLAARGLKLKASNFSDGNPGPTGPGYYPGLNIVLYALVAGALGSWYSNSVSSFNIVHASNNINCSNILQNCLKFSKLAPLKRRSCCCR